LLELEPKGAGLLGAADMEGQSSGGSRRPGTRAGLGPSPAPHVVSKTGMSSKVRPLQTWPSISDPCSHTPTHTAGTLVPLAKELALPYTHQAGTNRRSSWGLRGSDGMPRERDGVSHLQESPEEPCMGHQLFSGFAV
jgi:hypothetical protein